MNSHLLCALSTLLLVPFFASAIDTGGMAIALQPGIVATDATLETPEDGVFDVSVLLANNASVPRDVRYGATLIPDSENTLGAGKQYSVRADDFVRVLPGEKKMIAIRVVAPQFLQGPYQLFAQVLDRDGGVPTLLFVDDVVLSRGKEEILFQCKRAGVILDADMSLSLNPDEVLGDIACALIGREGMERSVITAELFRGGVFGPRVAVATAETGMVREAGAVLMLRDESQIPAGKYILQLSLRDFSGTPLSIPTIIRTEKPGVLAQIIDIQIDGTTFDPGASGEVRVVSTQTGNSSDMAVRVIVMGKGGVCGEASEPLSGGDTTLVVGFPSGCEVIGLTAEIRDGGGVLRATRTLDWSPYVPQEKFAEKETEPFRPTNFALIGMLLLVVIGLFTALRKGEKSLRRSAHLFLIGVAVMSAGMFPMQGEAATFNREYVWNVSYDNTPNCPAQGVYVEFDPSLSMNASMTFDQSSYAPGEIGGATVMLTASPNGLMPSATVTFTVTVPGNSAKQVVLSYPKGGGVVSTIERLQFTAPSTGGDYNVTGRILITTTRPTVGGTCSTWSNAESLSVGNPDFRVTSAPAPINGTCDLSAPNRCASGKLGANWTGMGNTPQWFCDGENMGAQSVMCEYVQCGVATGGSFVSAPSTNLCAYGDATSVTNSGAWRWTCEGAYRGVSCSANISSSCDSRAGQSCTSNANSCGMTSAGTYDCSGMCSASTPANSSCPSSGQSVSCGIAVSSATPVKPITNLCSPGSVATVVSGSGPWSWSCTLGGLSVSCFVDISSGGGNCNPASGNSCTSGANSCGMRNTGIYDCGGTCSATTPPESACTPSCSPLNNQPCTSGANSCGMRGSGIYNCEGVCGATMPPNSSCPSSCSPLQGTTCTSGANSCGMSNTGVYTCAGTCSVIPPPNELCSAGCSPLQGQTCTSAANSCGMTNSSTYSCSAVCQAVTPPDSACPSTCSPLEGQTCTSAANSCGVANTGVYTCAGLCSVTMPSTLNGTPCTSGANICGMRNSGTYNCANVCSATTPSDLLCLVCSVHQGESCVSGANSCGMTSTGVYNCGGTCTAVPPPESACSSVCSPVQGNGCWGPTNVCGMRDNGTYNCDGTCSVSTAPSNTLCPGGGGGGTPPPGGGGGGTPPPGGGGSTPDLQVVCDVLDYGTLPIFAPARTKSCHIQNIGGGILTGTFTLTPRSHPNNFTCSSCGAFTLAPLGIKNINIVLDPTIPGQYQANVTAIADTGETYGPRTAQGVVAYDGSSVRYDFGNVRVKTPPIGVLSDWIVITNNNPHLDIGSGILTGLSAPFTCESGGCAYGTIPRNGGTTRVRIRFTPTAVMQFGNEPRLRVTAPGSLQAPADLIRIELTGRGVPDSTEFDEI